MDTQNTKVTQITKRKRKTNLSPLLEKIPKEKKKVGEKLVEELRFMEEIIADLKEQIRINGTIEHFEQGKQSFLRENPALKSYNTTVQRYSALYRQLCDLAGKTQEAEKSNPIYDFIKEGIE